MNKPAKQPDDNLTADWPPDPDNHELARFAHVFQAGLPQLPASSMARVKQAMEEELALRTARRRFVLVVSSMAATLLVAVVGWVVLSSNSPPAPVVTGPTGPVVDHYAVTPDPVPTQVVPQRPLISLDEYRALVGEEQVAER